MKSKWPTIIILTLLWLVFTIIFSCTSINVPDNSTRCIETVKFLALSISAYGVLFSSVITSFNSLENGKINKENIEYNRICNSFKYLERFDSPSIKAARDITRQMKKEKSSLSDKELMKRIEGDGKTQTTDQKDLKRSVITMLNFFEEIYISILNKHSNEKILITVYKDMYIDIYDRFKCWIENEESMGKVQANNLKQLKLRWENADIT